MIKYWSSHNFHNLEQVQYFTKGLWGETMLLLDASSRGAMLNKSTMVVREMIDDIAHNEL